MTSTHQVFKGSEHTGCVEIIYVYTGHVMTQLLALATQDELTSGQSLRQQRKQLRWRNLA